MQPLYIIKTTYVNTDDNSIIDVSTREFATYKEARAFAKKLNEYADSIVFRDKGILILKVCNGINVIYTYHTEILL